MECFFPATLFCRYFQISFIFLFSSSQHWLFEVFTLKIVLLLVSFCRSFLCSVFFLLSAVNKLSTLRFNAHASVQCFGRITFPQNIETKTQMGKIEDEKKKRSNGSSKIIFFFSIDHWKTLIFRSASFSFSLSLSDFGEPTEKRTGIPELQNAAVFIESPGFFAISVHVHLRLLTMWCFVTALVSIKLN